VLPGGGGLVASAPGGMSVQVATGYIVVPSSTSSTFGGYLTGQYSTATLTIATSDPTNPRIDAVIVTITDLSSTGNGANSTAVVQVITGTPSATPSAPSLTPYNTTPNSSVLLATVTVPANSTSISSGNITDARSFTSANGGVTVVNGIANAPPGHPGMIAFDKLTNIFWNNPSNGPAQMKLLPFAPVMAVYQTSSPLIGCASPNTVTVLSVTFTSPGGVDIKVTFSHPGIDNSAVSGTEFAAAFNFKLDGTGIRQFYASTPSGNGLSSDGGTYIHHTNALTSDTPSAGTHTLTVTMQAFGGDGTHFTYIQSSPEAQISLRVEPVNL
jgi:hypothetical protein